MSAAVQRDETTVQATGTDGAPASALRQLAAERLAAHRDRRAKVLAPEGMDVDARIVQAAVRLQARRDAAQNAAAHGARPSVRDAVAARYQQTPSYQEFLAVEAERAMQKAQAEAEVAARNAVAVAEAQRRLLEEIEQWNQPPEALFVVPASGSEPAAAPPSQLTTELEEPHAPVARARRQRTAEPAYAPTPSADLTVQLYGEHAPARSTPMQTTRAIAPAQLGASEELAELDQEIAFRMAPEFVDHVVETQPIQANIIEFPRQLVASRKARPRLAEGPLREDGTPEPQLRIFEVEPEQFSTEPVAVSTAPPDWQSMVLAPESAHQDGAHAFYVRADAQTEFDPARNIAVQAAPELHIAPVSRRIMATLVDAVCVGASLVGFVALAVRLCGPGLLHLPVPELAAVAGITLAVFATLYQALFFSLNEATPGMRYARLGLCTFADANPSRRAIRGRLLATAVAVCPLGLGMFWMALDPDRLGWHDRISRMYPRAY